MKCRTTIQQALAANRNQRASHRQLEWRVTQNMRKLCLILSTLGVLWCPITTPAQLDFSSVEVFLKSTLKGEDRLGIEATGDLNGDGEEDWTGVVQRQKPNSFPTDQLHVLLRLRQGGYRVAEKSKDVVVTGMGCCWVENLEIRGSSIYIQTNEKTAGSMEVGIHQFKLYKGEWRLIGLRIFYLEPISDASITTDMNLLTGSVIERRQKGKNKPTTTRRYKKFAAYLLKDFDFSNEFGSE